MPRRRLRLIVIAGLALLAVVVAAIVIVRFDADPRDPALAPPQSTSAVPPDPTLAPASPADLPETDDPIRYARAVALVLYRWSTTDSTPSQVMAPLLDDADPSGRELNGLAADLRLHLPTTDQWNLLSDYDTAQDIRIDAAEIPDAWDAIEDENAEDLVPGTVAVTITGVRTRSGEWNGDQTSTQHPITFTVFVACSPGFDRCHLLRLSVPGGALGSS